MEDRIEQLDDDRIEVLEQALRKLLDKLDDRAEERAERKLAEFLTQGEASPQPSGPTPSTMALLRPRGSGHA